MTRILSPTLPPSPAIQVSPAPPPCTAFICIVSPFRCTISAVIQPLRSVLQALLHQLCFAFVSVLLLFQPSFRFCTALALLQSLFLLSIFGFASAFSFCFSFQHCSAWLLASVCLSLALFQHRLSLLPQPWL